MTSDRIGRPTRKKSTASLLKYSNATSTSQTRVDYYKIVLENVVVSSSNTVVADGELPQQTFGLKYGKITWEYKQHKMDGSSTSTGVAGWDLRKNVAV